MKVYILLAGVEYEGADVLGVYTDKAVAEAWLKWCRVVTPSYVGITPESYAAFREVWDKAFKENPGDYYGVVEREIGSEMPPEKSEN